MKKYGTVSVNDGFAKFVVAVVKQLPRDIDLTIMEDWVNNPASLKNTLRQALVARRITLPPGDLFRFG